MDPVKTENGWLKNGTDMQLPNQTRDISKKAIWETKLVTSISMLLQLFSAVLCWP